MLEEIVKRAVAELRAREKARDEVLNRARRARMLSKQAVLLIHNDNMTEAMKRIDDARRLVEEISSIMGESPQLGGFGEFQAAEEEYAEASILYGLKTSGAFPPPEAVGVPPRTYLLGLGDVVGELRREALDKLRVGDVDAAEAELKLMEGIYLSLLSMEEASLLLRGLRRKLDIARGVIESTRGELTTEAGRRRLGKSIQELMERLGKEKE